MLQEGTIYVMLRLHSTLCWYVIIGHVLLDYDLFMSGNYLILLFQLIFYRLLFVVLRIRQGVPLLYLLLMLSICLP